MADEESSFVRVDAELARVAAESAREALNRAFEDFKHLKEFKEEILEGGFASYCIEYEDDRDAIEKLYLNLDLSGIIPLALEDGVAEEDVASTQDRTPTALEVVQVPDAIPE